MKRPINFKPAKTDLAIPGNSGLERAKNAIDIINDCLPSPGQIRRPQGKTDQVRFVLRHDRLRSKLRPRQHPRVAAAFTPSSLSGNERSFLYGHPVGKSHVQVLVPVLGKDIGLTGKDRNDDPVTYVTTIGEAKALGERIAKAMPQP